MAVRIIFLLPLPPLKYLTTEYLHCLILQGTYIIPLLTSVLRDKSQWEKPDVFYPEHFLDSKGKFVKKDAFMPFSAGTFSFY